MFRLCLYVLTFGLLVATHLTQPAFAGPATPVITEHGSLAPELEPFRPFIGKTYRGEYKDSKSDQVAVDISQWERALNGQAVRILHSMDEGKYGGETILFYDQKQKKIRFYYFTTAGFYTEGEAEFDGTTFISREKVTGNANGITDVVFRARFDAQGTLATESEYLKGDTVAMTSTAEYRVVEGVKPVFK